MKYIGKMLLRHTHKCISIHTLFAQNPYLCSALTSHKLLFVSTECKHKHKPIPFSILCKCKWPQERRAENRHEEENKRKKTQGKKRKWFTYTRKEQDFNWFGEYMLIVSYSFVCSPSFTSHVRVFGNYMKSTSFSWLLEIRFQYRSSFSRVKRTETSMRACGFDIKSFCFLICLDEGQHWFYDRQPFILTNYS